MFAAGTVAAHAQQATETSEIAEIVIVTGSYIRGTAEDAALPVDVVTADDLAKQGSPSMIDIAKSIPAVQGIIGESNQFGVNQAAGTGNVNLRGLGAVRTLVLLNGRRLTPSPAIGVGVDINLLPMAAIGRIEVLKDGAAATYGSDAIAGVVNFITKENFKGISVGGSYSYIDDSAGDYDANMNYGWERGSASGLVSLGYRHRSELQARDRDFAVRSFTENPQGGFSQFSNPGTLSVSTAQSLANGGPGIVDPGCTPLGGVVVTTATGTTCRFQYVTYDNLVEEENHYQLFADFNMDLTDTTSFHAEALWAMHDVPEEGVSPSYGPNQGSAGGAPSYFVPLANPGIQALLAGGGLTAAQINAINTSTFGGQQGVIFSGLNWRPLAQGGNPVTGFDQENSRKFDTVRVSAGFNGEFGAGINWDTAATYMQSQSDISTPDFLVSRLGLALRGLGGPNCSGTVAGANGCLWLNPTSTGVASNLSTGQQNTVNFNANTVNDPALIRWLTTANSYESTTKLLTVDAVLSGDTGIALPGGTMGWAAGTQYRDNRFERDITDDFADIAKTPCADTPINGNIACTAQNGALSFYGPQREVDLKQDMFAVFGELSLPITNSLDAQLAVRFEDYGGRVGNTTNPKLSMRWQATDWLALRGSAGTTFRAPPQISLAPGFGTTLFFFGTGYKPVDTYGNADLKPETADTYNVGFIAKAGGFSATIDYWNFKFEDALVTEIGTQLMAAMFGPLGNSNANCTNPAYAGLRGRFTFADTNNDGVGDCAAANLLRTRVNNINAQTDTTISGIDASFQYQFDGVLGGDLTVGLDSTYNLEYEIGTNTVEGILIDPAQDAIGTRGGRGGSLPQWRGAAYVDLGTGMQNFRVTGRYIDSMKDVRTTIPVGSAGKEVDSFVTVDLTYQAELPADMTLGVSVFNVADEDPSFARLDLSYDPAIANPIGRFFKVGLTKRF